MYLHTLINCRRLNQDFVHRALARLQQTAQAPVKMAVGRCRTVHPFIFQVVGMCNDNEEEYKLLNVIPRSSEEPCRYCAMKKRDINMRPVGFQDPHRDCEALNAMGIASEEAYFKTLTGPPYARNYLSADEIASLVKCKANGIYPGRNSVLSLFDWHLSNGIGNPYVVSTFDSLHTLYKGPVEQCIRYAVTCIYLLRRKVLQTLIHLYIRTQNFINTYKHLYTCI
jgi:hypothetical protein